MVKILSSSILCLLLVMVAFATESASDFAPGYPVAQYKVDPGFPGMDVVTWTSGLDMPTPRYSHVTGWWNGKLYVAQGRISNAAPYNTAVCEAYDPALNTWATMAPAPTARRMGGFGRVQVGSKIYYVGGRDNSSVTVGTNECYDMATNTWTTLAPAAAHWAHGAGTALGYVFIFGTEAYGTAAQKFDPASNTWTTIAALPVGLGWVAGASLNNKVYACGGIASAGATPNVYEYDPIANTWTAVTPMPAARSYQTAVGCGGRIYVFGGLIGTTPTASVISWAPGETSWTDEGNLPAARYWEGCGSNDAGTLYCPGGASGSTSAPVYENDTWIGSTIVIPPQMDVNISHTGTIVIPANGGSFQYNINVHNLGTSPVSFNLWNKLRDTANVYYVVFGPISRTLPGGASPTRVFNQNVAGSIPSGTLYFISYVGTYPSTILDSSYFTITKSALADGNPFVSESYGTGNLLDEYATSTVAPSQFALQGAYPNPFNPTTNISFSLANASNVKLTVFDATGREVATLINGYRNAGAQQVTFDASKLASGIYLYQLNADGQIATGKMVLMK